MKTLLIFAAVGLVGCSTTTKKALPVDAPTASTQEVRSAISDGKTAVAEIGSAAERTQAHVGNARSLRERIDYKASILESELSTAP